MDVTQLANLYNVAGMTIIITGGSGVLGREMASALVALGANVAVIGRNFEKADGVVKQIAAQAGKGHALAIACDVLEKETIQKAIDRTLAEFGQIDGLINGAGGNKPDGTTSDALRFFDLQPEALKTIFDLNLIGTILPSQAVGRYMAERKQGVILNLTSMTAFRPLTRITAYSAAKAGVSNFTQWLATHMALEYSPNIRVNAIAPGFFLTEQNRFLMTDKDTGDLTKRGTQVLGHTPMGRFGKPEDLIGTMLWLLSPASAFVTGIVVPVDGGFSAYSGV